MNKRHNAHWNRKHRMTTLTSKPAHFRAPVLPALALLAALGLAAAPVLAETPAAAAALPTENAVLTKAPAVPPAITRRQPARVVVNRRSNRNERPPRPDCRRNKPHPPAVVTGP